MGLKAGEGGDKRVIFYCGCFPDSSLQGEGVEAGGMASSHLPRHVSAIRSLTSDGLVDKAKCKARHSMVPMVQRPTLRASGRVSQFLRLFSFHCEHPSQRTSSAGRGSPNPVSPSPAGSPSRVTWKPMD